MIAAMIKSAVVLAIAAGVASLMKRQSAAFRHAVWTAGLIGAMAIPLFTITLPSWETSFANPLTALIQRTTGYLGSFRVAAIALWVTGAAAGLLLLLYSAARLAWVAIGAEPVDDARWWAVAEDVRRNLGIRRPVRLLQNRSFPFLGTWGIVAPRVLLPRDAESWPDSRIRMVLAHELAHIQRHDWVVQVLADAARAIYWFNPIFWLASSRLRRESEHACDDAVIRLGAAGTSYAEELLAMTRALRSEDRLQTPILAMAQPSHLEQRLVALLNPSLNRLAATPWAVIVVAGIAIALTLPLAAVGPETESPVVAAQPAPPAVIAPPVSKVPQPEISPEISPAKTAPATRTLEEARVTQPVPSPQLVSPPPTPAPDAASTVANALVPAEPPMPFDCKVTASEARVKTATLGKEALGNGPWIINEDRTIWAADQPYVAHQSVNTVWMRPENTELKITAHRLDGDAPELVVGPAAPYSTGYVGLGVVFPAAGCWEVTGVAGTSRLTFITKVRD